MGGTASKDSCAVLFLHLLDSSRCRFFAHVKSFNVRWDEHVSEDRVMEQTPENEAKMNELQALKKK
jgi:hypothetical protein